MKKAFTIFLIPVFLFATTIGVSQVALYCGGKLKEKAFAVKACCKDVNKGGCCKTKSERVKVKDNFVKTNAHFNFSILVVENGYYSFEHAVSFKAISFTNSYWGNAPPLPDQPFYLLYRSLII